VLNNTECLPDEGVNHAVVLVGWGKTNDGVLYWIIKNRYLKEFSD
jgi:hypothetical protein